MKSLRNITLGLGLTIIMGACASSMNFVPSSVVPAATGKASVKRDKSNNYQIRVQVRNLAPAERLSPPGRTYVAWVETDRNSARKLGLIEPRSRSLEATLNSSSVAAPDRIFITVEDNPQSQYPSGREVLATRGR
jgi:hypothetical protein